MIEVLLGEPEFQYPVQIYKVELRLVLVLKSIHAAGVNGMFCKLKSHHYRFADYKSKIQILH